MVTNLGSTLGKHVAEARPRGAQAAKTRVPWSASVGSFGFPMCFPSKVFNMKGGATGKGKGSWRGAAKDLDPLDAFMESWPLILRILRDVVVWRGSIAIPISIIQVISPFKNC